MVTSRLQFVPVPAPPRCPPPEISSSECERVVGCYAYDMDVQEDRFSGTAETAAVKTGTTAFLTAIPSVA